MIDDLRRYPYQQREVVCGHVDVPGADGHLFRLLHRELFHTLRAQ